MQQLHIERNPIHLKLDDSLHVRCSDSPVARVAPSVLAQVHTWYSTVQYSAVQYSTGPHLVRLVVPVEAEVVRGPAPLPHPLHCGSRHLGLQRTLNRDTMTHFHNLKK